MSERELEGSMTFFYYNDLPTASDFYENVLGLKLVMQRDWLRIFKIVDSSHLGLVDKTMGSHKPSPEKPVRLQLWVKDIDAWYKHLKEKGLISKEIHEGTTLKIKTCTVKDPEGYSVEFCQFLTPYGE